MTDVLMTASVLITLAVLVALTARNQKRSLRPLLWFALIEYVTCAAAEIIYVRSVGGDMLLYLSTGAQLARFLDTSFSWSAPELLSMLFQQPSRFDILVYGPGSNTGSM